MTAAATDLLREVEAAGGQLIPLDDGRVRVTAPEPLPDDLMDRLRQQKPALIAHLRRVNPEGRRPPDAGSPRLARWDAETANLIMWFETTEPPARPFELSRGVVVANPARWWEALRRDIAAGPGVGRAYTGALQQDLRRLAEL